MRLPISTTLFAASALFFAGDGAHSQTTTKVVPKLEAVAETKLVMEGLAHANFRGLERILVQESPEERNWTFARGQALLIAETANLLMLRPPKNQGQSVWFERAMELRTNAAALGQTMAKKDLARARAGLQQLAGVCNRCHQTFRVQAQIVPFEQEQPGAKVE